MIIPNSPSTNAFFSTTRIEAIRKDGKRSVGTAFFFHFKVDDKTMVPVLITNKHVVQETTTGEFYVHRSEKDQNGKTIPAKDSFRVNFSDFDRLWTRHSTGVDLCAMPIQPLREAALKYDQDIYYIPFDETLIPSQETLDRLFAVEEVTMVGYPIGLWDRANNLPLARRGITASHPAADFDNSAVGLLDIAALPGSSGSPVMILNQGAFATQEGTTIGVRVLLLGVLHEYYYRKSSGEIQPTQIPTSEEQDYETLIPLHLGRYIKSREILNLKRDILNLIPPSPIRKTQ